MKIRWAIQGCLFLLILASCISTLKLPRINLRTFIGCAVREFTFLAKKPGCKGLRITTDACWGRCETWEVSTYGYKVVNEKPVLDPPYIEAYHRVCTYNETKLITVKLPNCIANVSPFYTYPKAIRCDCDICHTTFTECEAL